uniref:hypothetical protein n=1 Tax=Herbidospora sakaeratensis TaxID=564415 RepID=UPI0012F835F6|nr:hypothetical protein [Herbidospora sakaeratensis]
MTMIEPERHSIVAVTNYAAGQAETFRKMLLFTVEHRGFALTAEMRAQIAECADPEKLEVWAQRAISAERLEDIFR